MTDLTGGTDDAADRVTSGPQGADVSLDLQREAKEGLRTENPLDKISARMDDIPGEEEPPEPDSVEVHRFKGTQM